MTSFVGIFILAFIIRIGIGVLAGLATYFSYRKVEKEKQIMIEKVLRITLYISLCLIIFFAVYYIVGGFSEWILGWSRYSIFLYYAYFFIFSMYLDLQEILGFYLATFGLLYYVYRTKIEDE